jgi:hypothetical protein
MTSPEERRLMAECRSKIKRARMLTQLLAEKNMTVEEQMRLTISLREVEAECRKAENALQAFREANKAPEQKGRGV